MKKYKITVDSLDEAHIYFCRHRQECNCLYCPLSCHDTNRARYFNGMPDEIDYDMSCAQFVQEFPDGAAKIMGVEIVEVDEPKLTEREVEICRAAGAKWVSRRKKSKIVKLWKEKPGIPVEDKYITSMDASLFPSVKPRTLIKVEADEDEIQNDI